MEFGWIPAWILVIDAVLRLSVCVLVIMRRRPVTTSLAWLVVLLFVPFFGLAAYVLFGEVRLGARRARRYDELSTEFESEAVGLWRSRGEAAELPDPGVRADGFVARWSAIARYGASVTGIPPLGHNRLTLLADNEAYTACLERDIEGARQHCHLLYYIWMPDTAGERITAALLAAAARGVACRVLVDAVGSKLFLRSSQAGRLRAGGVKVVAALPVNPVRLILARLDLRNHRKIAVIDGRIGYCGSQNLTDSGFRSKKWRETGPWIDASVRVEGPAAQAMGVCFLRDWQLDAAETIESAAPFLPPCTDDRARREAEAGSMVQVVSSGPGAAPDAIHQALLTVIYTAREELIMTTPYFVPDEATRTALVSAAARGVEVTLIMPKVSDSLLVAAASRSHYLDLLEAGVRIEHYRGGLLHAKTITVDRMIALIGSANLDARSFWLNFESTLFIYDDDFASVLRFMQTGYLRECTRMHLQEWRARPRWRVFVENCAQLLGPLL